MTRSDRDTLSTALSAQAAVFERIGAKKLARDLRQRARRIASGIRDAVSAQPSPVLEPIPVRERQRR